MPCFDDNSQILPLLFFMMELFLLGKEKVWFEGYE